MTTLKSLAVFLNNFVEENANGQVSYLFEPSKKGLTGIRIDHINPELPETFTYKTSDNKLLELKTSYENWFYTSIVQF